MSSTAGRTFAAELHISGSYWISLAATSILHWQPTTQVKKRSILIMAFHLTPKLEPTLQQSRAYAVAAMYPLFYPRCWFNLIRHPRNRVAFCCFWDRDAARQFIAPMLRASIDRWAAKGQLSRGLIGIWDFQAHSIADALRRCVVAAGTSSAIIGSEGKALSYEALLHRCRCASALRGPDAAIWLQACFRNLGSPSEPRRPWRYVRSSASRRHCKANCV